MYHQQRRLQQIGRDRPGQAAGRPVSAWGRNPILEDDLAVRESNSRAWDRMMERDRQKDAAVPEPPKTPQVDTRSSFSRHGDPIALEVPGADLAETRPVKSIHDRLLELDPFAIEIEERD
jgi:hypothetical protein